MQVLKEREEEKNRFLMDFRKGKKIDTFILTISNIVWKLIAENQKDNRKLIVYLIDMRKDVQGKLFLNEFRRVIKKTSIPQ